MNWGGGFNPNPLGVEPPDNSDPEVGNGIYLFVTLQQMIESIMQRMHML